MLRRKFYYQLLEWKKNKKNECLLVNGARQVGKTFIIEQFGIDNYQSYIYIIIPHFDYVPPKSQQINYNKVES